MQNNSEKNPLCEIMITMPDGRFISVNELAQKKTRIEKEIYITQKQIAVREKLIRNDRYDTVRYGLVMLICLASLFVLRTKNPYVRKAGFVGALTTVVVNTGAICVLAGQKKKLEKQKDYWDQQTRSLA